MKVKLIDIVYILVFALTIIVAIKVSDKIIQLSTLTRSHAVMEYRQKILTEITCGYCHKEVPDWCDMHDGGK